MVAGAFFGHHSVAAAEEQTTSMAVGSRPARNEQDQTARVAPPEFRMNIEKIIFSFFIMLAMTLNFGFFLGDIDNPAHHNVYELFAAIVVNLIATVLKFGERTHIGAVLLGTSLVADLQLIAAALVWAVAVYVTGVGLTGEVMASIVALSGGALAANIVSVVLLIIDISTLRR
jgi:hypothetical protein